MCALISLGSAKIRLWGSYRVCQSCQRTGDSEDAEIPIKSMHCSSLVTRIQLSLQLMPGVVAARANVGALADIIRPGIGFKRMQGNPVMVVIKTRRFDAFIFDLDGVITQTAAVHARAWKKLFDSFLARDAAQTGKPFVPFDAETDYQRYVDGKPRVAGVVSFLASRNIELPVGKERDGDELNTAQGLAERKDQYFSEILSSEGVLVFDSAVALLTEARERGMRTAVASSSHHCAEILRSAKLTDFFDARVDGFDIDHLGLAGKPAPDMFLEAVRRLDVSPARGVVFEDATSGVAAGHAGGFGLVIGIGAGGHATDLLESGADEVVVNLSEVKLKGSRRHFGMP